LAEITGLLPARVVVDYPPGTRVIVRRERPPCGHRQLREQITRGELSLAAVLDRVGPDSVVARTRVADLLKALPGWNPVTVAALLSGIGIHADRRTGGLGRRQRQALLDATTGGSPMAHRGGPASAGQGLNEQRSGRSRRRAPR
jgi:hypothetical protein